MRPLTDRLRTLPDSTGDRTRAMGYEAADTIDELRLERDRLRSQLSALREALAEIRRETNPESLCDWEDELIAVGIAHKVASAALASTEPGGEEKP